MALDRRIAHAAKRLCGLTYGARMSAKLDMRRCMREAMASSAPQREQAVARANDTRARLALSGAR